MTAGTAPLDATKSASTPAMRGPAVTRPPAVAGRFYSANPRTLAEEVRFFLADARAPKLGRVHALVAPHAGYACSGVVAGASYRVLGSLPAAPRTIYLLGPAHWKAVHGIALASAGAFATPLGEVAVAVARVEQLAALGGQYRIDDAAHAPEHCLEVQLPFLQTVLQTSAGDLRIVPMLFDDAADPELAARDLCALLEGAPDDLVVVSTDLSHYHSYQDAIILDHALLKALATGDIPAANAGEACGLLPILCLMRIAEHFGWRPHLLAYANSGDTCGSPREVVGYGAVAYTT